MRMIDGRTKTCGLIGDPVEHTMSPAIHNFLAEKTGQNLAYLPYRVEEADLEAAVDGAYALGILGMNVTVPHKSAVIPFLDDIDPLAERIGAVNTLVRTDEGFKGYNTDMPGLYRAMQSDGIELKGESVLILGAGGVARAVAVMLADKGLEKIYILNRTLRRAEEIAREVNEMTGKELVLPMDLGRWNELPRDRKYIAIQATKVGMFPMTEEAVIADEAFYQMLKLGYDLVYNPMDTKFMQLVRAAGGKSFNGFKMLLYQGIIAFELWTGESISEELAMQTYEYVLGQMHQ
ncbi:MAG: shikimate dehydrogenase [Lachnospiraceae bacterium]|nr:shikimate dehydrogenase [Lachnospiraceae bacterium]